MIDNKRLLAIIPARGGSKRLPGKNTMELCGKPLVAWTIEAALGSKYIDRVIVSTDDDNVVMISDKYGADIPLLRPIELATDEATSIDVVLHLLTQLEHEGEEYDYTILLQPTSPLRTTDDINKSIDLLKDRRSDAVISVCEVEHSPLWCNTISDDGDLSYFLKRSILNKRSQDLEQYYRLNGAIYLCSVERIREENTFFLSSNSVAYKMSQKRSVDIDNEIDFLLAESLFKLSGDL